MNNIRNRLSRGTGRRVSITPPNYRITIRNFLARQRQVAERAIRNWQIHNPRNSGRNLREERIRERQLNLQILNSLPVIAVQEEDETLESYTRIFLQQYFRGTNRRYKGLLFYKGLEPHLRESFQPCRHLSFDEVLNIAVELSLLYTEREIYAQNRFHHLIIRSRINFKVVAGDKCPLCTRPRFRNITGTINEEFLPDYRAP